MLTQIFINYSSEGWNVLQTNQNAQSWAALKNIELCKDVLKLMEIYIMIEFF